MVPIWRELDVRNPISNDNMLSEMRYHEKLFGELIKWSETPTGMPSSDIPTYFI